MLAGCAFHLLVGGWCAEMFVKEVSDYPGINRWILWGGDEQEGKEMPSDTVRKCALMAIHWTCISGIILVSFIPDDPLGINAASCGPSLCMCEQSQKIPYWGTYHWLINELCGRNLTNKTECSCTVTPTAVPSNGLEVEEEYHLFSSLFKLILFYVLVVGSVWF